MVGLDHRWEFLLDGVDTCEGIDWMVDEEEEFLEESEIWGQRFYIKD